MSEESQEFDEQLRKENWEEKARRNNEEEVKITDFNRHMSKEERDYYGEYFDDKR